MSGSLNNAHKLANALGGVLAIVVLLAAFLIAMFWMMAFGFVIYQLRWREERVKERIEVLKSALED